MIELDNIMIESWEDLITGFHIGISGEIQFYFDKNIMIAGKHQSHTSILEYLNTVAPQ